MTNIPIHFDGNIYWRQPHGGITRVFSNLIRELSLIDSFDLSLHRWHAMSPSDLPSNVRIGEVVQTASGWKNRLRPWKVAPVEALSAEPYFRREAVGIFHATYYTTYETPRAKQVLTLHDMIFEDFPECFPNVKQRTAHIDEKRRCITAADVIVCDSHATLERLLSHYSELLAGKNLQVVHLGLDPQLNASEPSPLFSVDRRYILHVGSRHPHKNFHRLLEAMSRSELQNLDLVTVGGGEWKAEEETFISDNNLQSRVRVVPQASDDLLANAYRFAAAVAVPSLSEGFGLPLLEAMSHGCPVAASTGGSLPEVGGDLPYYFDPADVDAMVNAILLSTRLVDNETYRHQAIAQAKKFSWSDCARQYAAIYADLLNRN